MTKGEGGQFWVKVEVPNFHLNRIVAVDMEEPGLIGDGDISLVKGMTSEGRSGLGADTYLPSEEELNRRGPLLDRLPWSRC